MLGGYANKVAHIDLSSGSIEYKPIPEEWARKYLGARGLGVRYILENGPEVAPESPDNLLIFMNGPLTGTAANMSGRMAIVTRSPLTGTVTDSHHGGWSAARLRWAGFDGLIFKGVSDKPVYAYVHDGVVELKDASEVWGKGVHDTVKYFREKYGEKDLSVIAIGPAGENGVRFANWINEDDRASGRGGTGCVGGYKKLKAIVIKAEKRFPKPADPERFKAAHKRALARIMDENNITAPRKGGLSVFGTNVLMNIVNSIGALPSYNGKATYFEEAENVSGETVKETILIDDPTCHACPVACKKKVRLPEGSPFAGLEMESVEYESAWAFGPMCGVGYLDAVVKLIDMSNDLGMDTIEGGNVLAMYMEATERGKAPEGEGLEWGDWKGQIALYEKIAYRQGVGDILAEGTERAAKALGVPDAAMTVKGQAIPAYDPRGLKGMGIAYATSNRGACHLRAYTPASELNIMPIHIREATKSDPLAWKGKGQLVKIFQDVHAVSDSLNLCKFSAFAMDMDDYTDLWNGMTGLNYTSEEMLKVGERVYNLERYYNNLVGFREGSDYLPKRFVEEPSQHAASKGHVAELDQMLAEYYEARGWVNGVVPEAKLQELEII